eukprot:2558194-Pleurochrysis_carterae.AAC.4
MKELSGHDMRALELGVSENALKDVPPLEVDPRRGLDELRLLQWNILAHGYSDDGFLVPEIIGEAQGDAGTLPSIMLVNICLRCDELVSW